MILVDSFVKIGTVKPKFEVADVIRQYEDAYRREYYVFWEQEKAMRDIIRCRTAALGGYVEECNSCRRLRIRYCPCKNRNCPKCGAYKKAQWLAKQEVKLLPGPYFHVIFTIAHEVNELAGVIPCKIYDLLFHTAADMLKKYGRKYLGGEIGFTAVLHTWSQKMTKHIHVHFIVWGGALQKTKEGPRLRLSKKTFLFPAEELSKDFRDEFCKRLRKMHQRGELDVAAEIAGVDVEAMLKRMLSKLWNVFIKPAPSDPKKLCEYLGRYIRGIAISNYRILSIKRGRVRFKYYDNTGSASSGDHGQEKVTSLPAVEFLRRFLQHVLPFRFVRVRHYGLHHSSKREDRDLCRQLMGKDEKEPTEAPKLDLDEWLQSFLPEGEDPRQCPFCEEGRMYLRSEFDGLSPLKLKLLSLLGIPVRGAAAG
jgi:hypothetical protein